MLLVIERFRRFWLNCRLCNKGTLEIDLQPFVQSAVLAGLAKTPQAALGLAP
jgi:hypothetical protein